MKKAITLALCLFALALSANAQDTLSKKQLAEKGITLKMSYDDYKTLYNPRDYERQEFDPFSPAGSGIASFFIPGLGQMINGEGGRGVLMLGGHVLLWCAGIITPLFWRTTTSEGKSVSTTGANIVCITCLCADLALDIWSIVDAVNMAKVKNMYYHDCRTLRASSFDIKLMPSLAMVPSGQTNQAAAGVTLAVTF